MILICENESCHKEFERERRRRFCCLACAYEFSKGKPQNPDFVAKRLAAMRGKKRAPLSVEHRNKISLASRGRKFQFTEEHKKNLSLAAIRRFALIGTKPKSDWKPEEKVCPICDKVFLTNQPHNKYCCKKCANKAQWAVKKLKRGGNKFCLFCDKEFQGREHQKYCSYKCDKADRAKNAKVLFECPNCGKRELLRASTAKRRKYCNQCFPKIRTEACIERSNGLRVLNSDRMKGRNNPMFTHPESCHYKGCKFYEDLGLRLRSGWEANVARIFKAMGFHLEYEPKTFMLSDGTTYTPDFFIHETGEFIEVKGWWRGDAKAKVELFQSDYPGLPFDVISGSKYKELVKEFGGVAHVS